MRSSSPSGVGIWLGWSGLPGKGRAIGVGEVKFRGDTTPSTRLARYEVSLRQARRGKLALGVASGRLFADDACVYVAADPESGHSQVRRLSGGGLLPGAEH